MFVKEVNNPKSYVISKFVVNQVYVYQSTTIFFTTLCKLFVNALVLYILTVFSNFNFSLSNIQININI